MPVALTGQPHVPAQNHHQQAMFVKEPGTKEDGAQQNFRETMKISWKDPYNIVKTGNRMIIRNWHR